MALYQWDVKQIWHTFWTHSKKFLWSIPAFNTQKIDQSINTLKVPFLFNLNTDIGPVQIGDYYFGCITANDYWSKEHSECEKRFIQHLDKSNDLPEAH